MRQLTNRGKCANCNKGLPPRRSRFCTNTCAKQFGIDRAKKIRAKYKLEKKKCDSCGDFFQPKVAKHRFCTIVCWTNFNAEKIAEKRKEAAAKRAKKPKTRRGNNFIKQHLLHIEGVKPVLVRDAEFTKATTIERAVLQTAVEKYLAAGGLIKKYVIQPVFDTDENDLRWGITEKEEDEIKEMYK